MTNHLRLDFNLVENLTVVDGNDRTNHLRDDDHVAKVGLNDRGLLAGGGFLLGSTKLLDETHGLTLQATLESSASTAVDELHELKSFDNTITSAKQFGMVHLNASATNYLLRREVQKLVEVNTTVRELAEGSALLGSLFLVSLLTKSV